MIKLIVANWKQHPETSEEALVLAVQEDLANAIICPPTKFLKDLKLARAKFGAQDIEIPIQNLIDLGVEYVILGHSQRRLRMGETDEMINSKVLEALINNLTPILCLGENVDQQFTADTKGVDDLLRIIFVYEPIWAISSEANSKPVDPDKANKIIEHIHELAGQGSRVLYGGTVNKDNAADYAKYPAINGVLVGAASLDSENFKIIHENFSRS